MPERVVDLLQAVEVEHHDAEVRAGAVAAGELALEVLVERAVVAEPGEAVGERRLLEPRELVAPSALEPPAVAGEAQEEDGAAREADDDQKADRGERELLDQAVGPRVRGATADVGEESRERRVQRGRALIELTNFTGGEGGSAGELVGPEAKTGDEQRVPVAHEAGSCRVVAGAVVADATQVELERRGGGRECLPPASRGRGAQGRPLEHERVARLLDCALEPLGLLVGAGALRRRERAPEADARHEDHGERDARPRRGAAPDRFDRGLGLLMTG